MIEKITLEKFMSIKEQLQKVLVEAQEKFEKQQNQAGFDEKKETELFLTEYLAIQAQLLSYDLSDIPFDAWNGMTIVSDENHPVDFSSTKANLDFSIVNVGEFCNFKGCNVKNLERLYYGLNEEYFDEQTIRNNSSLFLSDSFDSEFKSKYRKRLLTVDDLAKLSPFQLVELSQKKIKEHLDYSSRNIVLFDTLGVERVVSLYNYSKELFDLVYSTLNTYVYDEKERNRFIEKMKNAQLTEMKEICFEHLKNIITSYYYGDIDVERIPKLFVKENQEFLLIGDSISQELREKYYKRRLELDDIINNQELFKDIPVYNFLKENYYISEFVNAIGIGKLDYLIKKYPLVIKHLVDNGNVMKFLSFFNSDGDIDKNFIEAVKEYYIKYGGNSLSNLNSAELPDWIASMNFEIVESIKTPNDLLNYNSLKLVLNYEQRQFLKNINIENLKRFESEVGLFTGKGEDMQFFNNVCSFLVNNSSLTLFKNGDQLPDEEFDNAIASILNEMREKRYLYRYSNYDWIEGPFRERHPEIFIDKDAPEKLKDAFYSNYIDPILLRNKDYIPFIINKNLSKLINCNTVLKKTNEFGEVIESSNFISEYSARYGNEKTINLLAKYGNYISSLSIDNSHNEIENEQLIEKAIRDSIYEQIKANPHMETFDLLEIPEFVSEHPEYFVNLDSLNISDEEKNKLTYSFYKRGLSLSDLHKYPELIDILKEKNLSRAFGSSNIDLIICDKNNKEVSFKEKYGQEKLLRIFSKYGDYLDKIIIRNSIRIELPDYDLTMDVNENIVETKIEDIITERCKNGLFPYNPDTSPDFLKEKHPELFLDDSAPEALKKHFYNQNNTNGMTFSLLSQNKSWLSYLEGKSIITSLLRVSSTKSQTQKFFDLFGYEKAMRLGMNKGETVEYMIDTGNVDKMKQWYDKTGGKFIPDFAVMLNFNIEEADKFLLSGQNWSQLMRIKQFSKNYESREAMLKLAYCFGAFDNDPRGFKKTVELLTALPRKLDSNLQSTLDRIDSAIDFHSQRGVYYKNTAIIGKHGAVTYEAEPMTDEEKEKAYNRMIERIKNSNYFNDGFDKQELLNLLQSLKEEKVNIDFSYSIFSQLYRKNNDGSLTLTINDQNYPKSASAIRDIMSKYVQIPIITPEKAHILFGSFAMKYEPDFREFLLKNLDEILNNPSYGTYLSSIQKRFSEIKAVNSNRALTLDLAVSFVQENKYASVNPGNEKAAEMMAFAGYSQEEFDILQRIYNYGKQRVFSSIPRIESKTEKYTYEILRLDDPLAMAIGTLSDCCQEISNCAEMCMEHSMVDKNGRVFVIKDNEGNIVAQSWVWRNKDILCFDNIEIPKKAFARAEESSLTREEFTKEVFDVYKQAAKELIEKDEQVYKSLLESGKITQEQYDYLRLGKITAGIGYNDIAETLTKNAKLDVKEAALPPSFEPPVKLSRPLYISDSRSQYILEEREDRKTDSNIDLETIPVHKDEYKIFDDSNFDEKMLLTLKKLELITKENPSVLETANVGDEKGAIISNLAMNYRLNPQTTRVVMNPNFGIIFDIFDDKIIIADLLFNTKIDNNEQQFDITDKVVMQIRLALNQIANGKEIDISSLNEKQIDMFNKAMGLNEEMDVERGVSSAR